MTIVSLQFTNFDPSGDVFQEPYSIKASNDRWPHLVTIFNDTSADEAAYGVSPFPDLTPSSVKLVIVVTATVTAGQMRFQFNYRAVSGSDAESLDQSGVEEAVEGNVAAPSAVNKRMVLELTLTQANFAAKSTIEFDLTREGSDGVNDTMAAAAIVHEVRLECL